MRKVSTMTKNKLVAITPNFNDNRSLPKLINDLEINTVVDTLVIIDDASDLPILYDNIKSNRIKIIILRNEYNQGHQNSIYTGIAYVLKELQNTSHLLILDSDGEDNPSEINKLYNLSLESGFTVLATRGKRNDGIIFRLLYKFYKILFKLLTGYSINYGNFMCLPYRHAEIILAHPDSRIHIASSVAYLKIKNIKVQIDKSPRYFGKSKMSYLSLIDHALSSIHMFRRRALIRMIILMISLMSIILTLIFFIILLKILGLTVPGWASIFTLILFSMLLIILINLISLLLVTR